MAEQQPAQQAPAQPKKRRWGDGAPAPATEPPAATKAKTIKESVEETLARIKQQALLTKQAQELAAQRGQPLSAVIPGVVAPAAPMSALDIQVAAARAALAAQALKAGVAPASGLTATPAVLPFSATNLPTALQQSLLQAQQTAQQRRMAPGWAPLILDDKGRQVDQTGKVVDFKRDVDSLMVNKPKVEAPPEVPVVVEPPKPQVTYYDPRFNSKPGKERTRKRDFSFAQPGKYVRRAQNMRQKQLTEEMKKHAGEDDEEVIVRSVLGDSVPSAEWWDLPLLNNESYAAPHNLDVITSYIHVPAMLDPAAEKPLPPPQPLMLTKEERKKIRRMRKIEREREKQDLIRIGELPAPEAKVKLSTIMRVLGTEAVAGPSSVEAKVRSQMAARQKKHDQHNQERALTAQQKKEKKARKFREDTSVEVHIAVFRAGDLADNQRLYKVMKNAEQYHLTGRAIVQPDCNVVIVEGGPRGIKKYTRLMLHRIQWGNAEDEDGMDDGDDSEGEDADAEAGASSGKGAHKCTLVWKGTSDKHAFKEFLKVVSVTETAARKHLAEKGVAHYWDLCKKSATAMQ